MTGQKDAVDRLLGELTPLEGGIQDVEALEGWIRMVTGKVDIITEELKRLQEKTRREYKFLFGSDRCQCRSRGWKSFVIHTV